MHYNVGNRALEIFEVSNLIREETKQIFLFHCVETVLEWCLIVMAWPVMPVDMFRHKSEIYVSFRFENKLIRRIIHCSEIPRFPYN
jgi:hypothetical protein